MLDFISKFSKPLTTPFPPMIALNPPPLLANLDNIIYK
jgi:hypothetical protein